jgi:hypothetical protein
MNSKDCISSDETQYRGKATPFGKSRGRRRALAHRHARFVVLEFILRKRRLVMVNAGFLFATPHSQPAATGR